MLACVFIGRIPIGPRSGRLCKATQQSGYAFFYSGGTPTLRGHPQLSNISHTELEGELEGRGQLRAYNTTINIRQTSGERGNVPRFEIQYEAHEWSVKTKMEPMLWLSKLDLADRLAFVPGNFQIRRQMPDGITSITQGHLGYERVGLRTFILTHQSAFGTHSDPETWIVLDPTSVDLDMDFLWRDWQVLRVALGIPIRPGTIYGVSPDGESVAAMRLSAGLAEQEVGSGTESLVPLRTTGPVWVAPFIEKLIAAYTLNPVSPVGIALYRYGHSLGKLDVDTAYILVAGAIESVARAILIEKDALFKVSSFHNSIAWKHWVESQADEIESIAGEQSEVVKKRLLELTRPKGRDFVRAALEILDIKEGDSLLQELENVEAIFSKGVIGDQDYDIYLKWTRVQQLRRAFAILLSGAIGYRGPVTRFVRNDAWLPEHEASQEDMRRAKERYICSASLEPFSAASWPEFRPPVVPNVPLVNQLSQFAEGLYSQTRGAVSARLRPLPKRPDEPSVISFRLIVNRSPEIQTSIFSIEVRDDEAITITGWEDEPLEISSESALDEFMQTLATSPDLKKQVQRLLLIDEEVRFDSE